MIASLKLVGSFINFLLLDVMNKNRYSRPDVSIIIPVYNCQNFIKECLDSLIVQTLDNFEVIIVDDGSSDLSVQIVKDYLSRDARFSLIQQNHQFAGTARNVGIDVAKGEYLLFLDSDDFFDRNLLKEAYITAKTYNADICVFGASRYDDKTKKITKMTWVCDPTRCPESVFSKINNCENLFSFTSAAPWTKLFKREFILDKNIRFQKIRSANDVLFVLTSLAEAERIVILDKQLVFYRVNSGNSLQQTKDKDPFSFYKAISGLKQELIKRGLYEHLEKPFLNYALNSCIFNLKTLKNKENFVKLFNELNQEIFPKLNFAKYDQNFYSTCGSGVYSEYQKIIKLTCDEYIRASGLFIETSLIETQLRKIKKNFSKVYWYYKSNGIIKTIKRLFFEFF